MTSAPPVASTLPVPLPATAPPGIYVHVPFCRHICPYCDFNTYAGQDSVIPAYVDALLAELRLAAANWPTRDAPTLFFGGGTPSLLPAEAVRRIVEAARAELGLRADAEVTLEANPETLTLDGLRALRAAGVNRLSLGIQSQQRAGLRVLGRGHQSLEAGQAFGAARVAGFDNISLDFIFGWPGQRAEDWESDLRAILAWAPEHVSLYSLIVEPGTPMHSAVQRGILTVVDDDTVADFYEAAVATLGASGWEHYEIANWAREPRYRSRHNQLYWQNGAYHGLGAGAHGHLGATRASNLLRPEAYIAAVRAGELPRALSEDLTPETALGETLMLGLRLLRDGVSLDDVRARHGVDPSARYAAEIARFSDLGLLTQQGDRLLLTARGALLANDVCAAFLP
jgi:oxygen-independent coproporphyrinogen-3 oxidase